VWSFLIVEFAELIERFESPALLVVRLEEPLDLPVGLWPTNCTQRVLDLVGGQILLEDVACLAFVVSVGCVKLRAVIRGSSRIDPVEA
jgi:hypothetical protein